MILGHCQRVNGKHWPELHLRYGGTPKGVVIHHRGAYLMAMGTVPAWVYPASGLSLHRPMFHCNGWGHAWLNALVAAQLFV